MAERRMYSKRVVYTSKFLKMPVSTQNLYFHLNLNADDDGVVEAYTIMTLIGATEDDLKILVAKELVQVLNSELVTYITDWRENNKLRADRKVDSVYKDLLLKVIPNLKLLESKPRADTTTRHILDVQVTSNGLLSIGKDSVGKDSVGKDSVGKDSVDKKNIFKSDALNKAFSEWLEHKKQRKEKYTEIGINKLISQINNQLKEHSENEIIDLIDNCIASNYQGIIFEKLTNKTKNNTIVDEDMPIWVNKMGDSSK